jgi:hypothetical protein
LLSYSFTDGHQILDETNSLATRINLTLGNNWWTFYFGNSSGAIQSTNYYGRLDGAGLADGGGGRNECALYCDGSHVGTWTVTTPEPSTVALLGAGLVALSASLWRGRARG